MSGADATKEAQKLQKKARKIRSGLHPAVKVSSTGEFRDARALTLPKMEILWRREDKCDLVTYMIPVNSSWFRVFFTNSSAHPRKLCPVHVDAAELKKELPSLTVPAGQERDIELTLAMFRGDKDQRMEIFGDNNIMLLELRFSCLSSEPDTFYPALEDPESDSDDDDRKPLAAPPRVTRSQTLKLAARTTDACLVRMQALLR